MPVDLITLRRDLHRHPETGLDLPRTSGRIAGVLERAGLEVTRNVGGSGLVATLRRGDNDNAIGLRADMDALPITEAGRFDHRSTIEGRFHGCGHDGHSTMLVGAALELAGDPGLNRTVHFIFQADEETGHGARAMIDDGVFDRFPMTAIYGLHNFPGTAVGHFLTGPGPFCAFEDNFEIRITGRGGHSSMPEDGVDPIVVGAAIVGQVQSIVSRAIPARDHAVVSVTEFTTDGARNILPSNVVLSGDCRGYSDAVSTRIEARMRQIASGVAAAHGASVEVSYSTSFHPLINDPNCAGRAATAAGSIGAVKTDCGRYGFSEDFAEFLRHCPGAFTLMGNGISGAHALPLHNPGYDFNDAAIGAGVNFWKALCHTV